MNVLLADDDLVYRHALERTLLKWGYEVTLAADGKQALEILQGIDPPRIAILDWMMPGMNGLEICGCIRNGRNNPYVYIILITAKKSKRDLIEGLKAQADDYLVKPFDLQELQVRLLSGRRIIDLQNSLVSQQRELSHKATHDALTGIWNRSAILEIVSREATLAKRLSRPFCLALADVDNFKRVNDTYGHAGGDGVLVEVVRQMQLALRRYDAIGRYGGEEFIVVMPGITRHLAFKMAERIRMHVADHDYWAGNNKVSMTLSVGVSSDDGDNAGNLLRAADEALYRAKAKGRNRVEISWDGIRARHVLEQC